MKLELLISAKTGAALEQVQEMIGRPKRKSPTPKAVDTSITPAAVAARARKSGKYGPQDRTPDLKKMEATMRFHDFLMAQGAE